MMKKTESLLFFLALSLCGLAQEIQTLVFEDCYSAGGAVLNATAQAKHLRVSAVKYGYIDYTMPSGLSNSTRNVIEASMATAADVWRSYLKDDTLNVEICCEDLGTKDTVTSAYTSHRFYLSSPSSGVSNHHWTYKLPLLDGSYQTVMQSYGTDIRIPAVANASNYQHNIDGEIEGLICFEGTCDGHPIDAVYKVRLGLKPKVVAEILSITPNASDSYFSDITIGISYQGSNQVKASVTEEYSSTVMVYHSYVPYYTTITLEGVDLWDFAWIDIEAKNEYGTTVETIEQAPEHYVNEHTPPNIVESSLSYDGFDAQYGELIEPRIILKIAPFSVSDYGLMVIKLKKEEEYFPFTLMYQIPSNLDEKFSVSGDTLIFDDFGDWFVNFGSRLCFAFVNHSGKYFWTDTVYVDDLITDSAVWAGRHAYLSVSDVENSGAGNAIALRDGQICLGCPVRQASLFTLSGKLLCTVREEDRIAVGSLPPGLYIVSYVVNGSIYNKKVYIR